MRLTKEDKNVLIYSTLLIITGVLFIMTRQIKQRGSSIIESPRLFPYIVEGCMALLSVSGILQSLRQKGRPTPAKILASVKACATDQNVRSTLLAILIAGTYIFLGIPYLGFYISSFLLICGITIGYVRSIRFYWAIPIAVALTGILYLIFAVAFNLRLR